MNQQNYAPIPIGYPPLSQTIAVISPIFCSPDPIQLTIIRKLMKLTAGNFAVEDENGNTVFHIKNDFTFFRDRRVLQDASRNPIVTMQRKMNSLHRRYQVFKGDSKHSRDLLFSVKESSYIQFKTKLHVFLATNTGEEVPDFTIKGTWLERSCTVYGGNSNTVIAKMEKKHSVKSVILGKDTFAMTVHPSTDYAFIVVLIVILDAINNSKSSNQ